MAACSVNRQKSSTSVKVLQKLYPLLLLALQTLEVEASSKISSLCGDEKSRKHQEGLIHKKGSEDVNHQCKKVPSAG